MEKKMPNLNGFDNMVGNGALAPYKQMLETSLDWKSQITILDEIIPTDKFYRSFIIKTQYPVGLHSKYIVVSTFIIMHIFFHRMLSKIC